MKHILHLSIVAIVMVALSSCGGAKTAKLEKKSPNGQVTVTINATTVGMLEPWRVTMETQGYSQAKGQVAFEVYAKELDDATVSFDWQSDDDALITFAQQDGTKRIFQLQASEKETMMTELGNGGNTVLPIPGMH